MYLSLFAIWGVDPLGLDPLPFKSQKIPKTPRSSCLTVVSPRGSNEAKETAGMNGFSYQSTAVFFSGEAVDLNNGNQSNDK